jgi:hypothetical protein
MSEHEDERAQPLPYDCLKCRDTGILLDMSNYCTCKAGLAAEEEDRGSD